MKSSVVGGQTSFQEFSPYRAYIESNRESMASTILSRTSAEQERYYMRRHILRIIRWIVAFSRTFFKRFGMLLSPENKNLLDIL